MDDRERLEAPSGMGDATRRVLCHVAGESQPNAATCFTKVLRYTSVRGLESRRWKENDGGSGKAFRSVPGD
uniref:Uncharacterized protein n=1 Tax=Oryza glumipatula TaxID=40148 RepID=A0A0D9ZPN0_9ORYZ